jgi:methionyl-tRNA formyltransferase
VLLERLLAHAAPVVGVLELDPARSAQVCGYARLEDLAGPARIPCRTFEQINAPATVELVGQWRPDLLFVVGLSQLVKPQLLALPRMGCVGFHPTWLPAGRGRAPLAWLTHDGVAGAATLFLMDDGADSGPILMQEPFAVGPHDYAEDVERTVLSALGRGLDRWLPELLRGHWAPTPQEHAEATYFGRRGPEDGLIDWHRPAEEIQRLVRVASRPHPGAYTYAGDERLIVWRASVATGEPHRGVVGRILDDRLGRLVQTGAGLLRLEEWAFADVPPAGAAHRLPVGLRLGYAVQDEVHGLRQQVHELAEELQRLRALLEQVPGGVRRCA